MTHEPEELGGLDHRKEQTGIWAEKTAQAQGTGLNELGELEKLKEGQTT